MLTGNYLQNFDSFRYAINSEPVQDNVIKLNSDNNVFYFQDGSVWMFQEYQLTEPSLRGYVQTVALDVSEVYYNNEEIKRNNEKLAEMNQKLVEMYERIGDEIREQETLSLKMQVHDNFGRSLLSIRRILENKEPSENMKEQLETLKQQVYILTNTTVADKENQDEDTEKQAEELGISIQIHGSYPNTPAYRHLTDRAIRECVTNCARHAHGNTVFVIMKRLRNEYQIQITNDGELPSKDSKEGGGLSALRKAVEAEGGSMNTFFKPAFYLLLNLPICDKQY